MVHRVYHGIDIIDTHNRGLRELVGQVSADKVFSPSEMEHISYPFKDLPGYRGIDIQSAAANIAMREALVKVWMQAFGQRTTILDFEIGYGEWGQPFVKGCPMPKHCLAPVSLSSSHDGDMVIGSAALVVEVERFSIPKSAYDLSKPYSRS